jgi:hypothetical protein
MGRTASPRQNATPRADASRDAENANGPRMRAVVGSKRQRAIYFAFLFAAVAAARSSVLACSSSSFAFAA